MSLEASLRQYSEPFAADEAAATKRIENNIAVAYAAMIVRCFISFSLLWPLSPIAMARSAIKVGGVGITYELATSDIFGFVEQARK